MIAFHCSLVSDREERVLSIMRKMMELLLLLAAASALVSAVSSDDEFAEPCYTKQEAAGFLNAWCKKEEYIVSFMTRKINCRNQFLVCFVLHVCLSTVIPTLRCLSLTHLLIPNHDRQHRTHDRRRRQRHRTAQTRRLPWPRE